MDETNEHIMAILHRIKRVEELLERMDSEIRSEDARRAAFDVRWDQLMKEHIKMQEHIKENWERINSLEQEPTRKHAKLWETFTGRIILLIGTAIATAIITHIPQIIQLFWR